MFNEKILAVLAKEGVVSIVSCANNQAHVVNTWNTSLTIMPDNKLLIPAAGMRSIENDVAVNDKVQLTMGSNEIEGLHSMGAGFHIDGTARFLTAGEEYTLMKEKYPFLTRVLQVTVNKIRQTL